MFLPLPPQASFKVIKPGLHWDAVQLLCHLTLVRGFKRLGIFRADADEAAVLAAGVSAAFFPHGVGHSLGMDVHDVPSASKPAHNPTIAQGSGAGAEPGHEKLYEYLRLRLPLEEGMVVVRFGFSLLGLRVVFWQSLMRSDRRRSSQAYISITICLLGYATQSLSTTRCCPAMSLWAGCASRTSY